MGTNAAIELKNITKTFGHVVANKDVCLTVNRGEILSILGENGSGKTTLMNMISGIYFPDHGQIFINGEEVVIRSPKDAFDYKIGMIHQHFKLVDVFSAAENIVLGLDEKEGYNLKRSCAKIKAISEQYGFEIDPNKKIYEMSVSEKQTVEIIKVLYRGADILILDEPTRGIDVGAKYEIYCIIADLAKQGKSIIMISSEMSEIIGMSNRVMVMCDGRITGFINGKDATQENIMALATQFETAPDTAAANQ